MGNFGGWELLIIGIGIAIPVIIIVLLIKILKKMNKK